MELELKLMIKQLHIRHVIIVEEERYRCVGKVENRVV